MALALRFSWYVLVIASFAAVGCSSKPGPSTPTDSSTPPPDSSGPAAGPSGGSTSPESGPSAKTAALDFLHAVGEGKAPLDRATPGFLKAIAEPVLPSDVEKGYDAAAAREWFAKAEGVKGAEAPVVEAEEPGAAAFIGPWSAARQHGYYAIRMAREAGTWKVDWFQMLNCDHDDVTPGQGVAGSFAKFAALCAADALVKLRSGRDDDLAYVAALLKPDLRRRLGPPFASDQPRGYNVGQLRDKLMALADKAVLYRLKLSNQDDIKTFLVYFQRMDRSVQTVMLSLVKGPTPGQWLVDDAKVD